MKRKARVPFPKFRCPCGNEMRGMLACVCDTCWQAAPSELRQGVDNDEDRARLTDALVAFAKGRKK